MRFISLILIMFAGFSLVACGNDSGSDDYKKGSLRQRTCTQDFLDSYDALGAVCKSEMTIAEKATCKVHLQEFVDAYPKVVCTAKLKQKNVTLRTSDVQADIDELIKSEL